MLELLGVLIAFGVAVYMIETANDWKRY